MDEIPLPSLSQVRHDLNLFPKQFESDPHPILVEQYGKPVMAVVPIEVYALMEGALDYIKEKGLQPHFENWLEQIDQELSEGLEANAEEAVLEEAPDESDVLALFRAEGMLGNAEFRALLKGWFTKTLAELDNYENQTALTP